jgi:hypothetical protein
MNSESLAQRQLAIRECRQYLDHVYSKDGAAPKRAGLVALSRAVYLLATRRIVRPEARGHDAPEDAKLLWEWDWYFQYLEALVELTPRLQAAIHDRRITPRGIRTSAPIDIEQIRQWLEIDAKAAIAASTKAFVATAMPEDASEVRWPHASVLPNAIFVTALDFAAWADAEGIAMPDEIIALLSDAQHSASGTPEKAAPPAPAVAPAAADDDGWEANAWRLADEIGMKKWSRGERQFSARSICEPVAAELGKGTTNNPTVWWGTQGPRSAGAIRTALKGWQFTPPNTGTNGTSCTE